MPVNRRRACQEDRQHVISWYCAAGPRGKDWFTSEHLKGGGDLSPEPKLTVTDVTGLAVDDPVFTTKAPPHLHRNSHFPAWWHTCAQDPLHSRCF